MKKIIHEITIMRSLACLAILLMHSATMTLSVTNTHNLSDEILETIQMSLMFGTPMFVFISEFVLSNAYQKEIPEGFWLKRVKYILFPFLIMAIFYAGVDSILNNSSIFTFVSESLKNIFLGYFHGYFIIIIIFQFYLLHVLFIKFVSPRFSDKTVLTITILINVVYLSIFNFVDLAQMFSYIPKINTIVGLASILPFLAWIGYFSIAFYCGKNQVVFLNMLKKYKYINIVLLLSFYLIFMFMHHSGLLTAINSRRIDVFFYTICLIFVVYYFASHLKKVPKIFSVISKYSFGIYLLHPFYLTVFQLIIVDYLQINYVISDLLGGFLFSLILSIVTTNLLNKVYFGKFIVGNVKQKSSQRNIARGG